MIMQLKLFLLIKSTTYNTKCQICSSVSYIPVFRSLQSKEDSRDSPYNKKNNESYPSECTE